MRRSVVKETHFPRHPITATVIACVVTILSLTLGILAVGVLVAVTGDSAHAAAAKPPTAAAAHSLPAQMDALLARTLPADAPGGAVIVVKDGQTLFRKAYGMADLEQGIRMTPEAVFRLGSVTKQFTAVAILLLQERGQLNVGDPITKYLPDYPAHGKIITIEHLLTHTSGVPSYTELPAWLPTWGIDLTVQQILDFTRDLPLDFDPGTRFKYSNTGYILLGAIIEKVSGVTYERFLADNIFRPLGMTHTAYGSNLPLIRDRIPGYSRAESTFVNARYLSMTHPYAAGALVSTIDDMALWDAALANGRILTPASRARMWTSYTLADGSPTGYGYGWGISNFQGHPVQSHDGGINGFSTAVLRMPDEHAYVAVLENNDSADPAPGGLALKLAAIAIGHPLPEPVTLTREKLDAFVGVYQIDSVTVRLVRRDGGTLTGQRTGRPAVEIQPTSDSTFIFPQNYVTGVFRRDKSGKVAAMVVHQQAGDELAPRTDKPVPALPVAAKVDPAAFDALVGRYEIAPTFVITIRRQGDHLFEQATGQSALEIFPKSETEFFLTAVDAQISFEKGADGRVTRMVLHQGGHDTPGARLP